jgi:hypothetical protein
MTDRDRSKDSSNATRDYSEARSNASSNSQLNEDGGCIGQHNEGGQEEPIDTEESAQEWQQQRARRKHPEKSPLKPPAKGARQLQDDGGSIGGSTGAQSDSTAAEIAARMARQSVSPKARAPIEAPPRRHAPIAGHRLKKMVEGLRPRSR